jgi:hypothetical protein
VRDFSASTPGYFSIYGGITDLADFNTSPFYPAGDWAASVAGDAFDADPAPSVVGTFSTADATALNVLGWNLAVACFAAGTRILTEAGEVPVEKLRAGERVVSAFGGTVPVLWSGRRRVDCRRHPRPQEVWPVRIRAGAFDVSNPRRDLLLSPDHAVFIEFLDGAAAGVLIPIRYLINGSTIEQQRVRTIEYWHVELPQHDVIMADGLPTESYLDTGNRSAFEGGGPALRLHADFAQQAWHAQACAAQITRGPILTAVRRRLAARARDSVRARAS